MRAQDSLAEAIRSNKTLIGRYLKGFSDANHTKQAAGLPNHVAWNLGHIALTMHRVAERLDGQGLPVSEFVSGAAGNAQRFASESVAFGSMPTGDSTAYPAYARCVAIFEGACERLASAVSQASDAQLAAETPWGAPGMTMPMHLLVARMSFHNGMHCGQIADLRRALGMGSIFS